MLALAASAAMWAAVVVAWAVERGLFDVPLRKWSGLPFVRKVLFAMASAAVVAWGAPKPPSGAPMRMAPAPVVEPVAVDAVAFSLPTNLPPVTNLCFWGIERGPNSVALGLAWPPSLSLTNGCIDLFGHWRLATNGWAHLAQIDVSGAQSNAVVELPFADFPTNAMASTAFFRAADRTDSDGDGLSDAFERLVPGSSPTDSDTDGDGIADGDEVLLGSDPNCEDSDHDGVPDREELGSIELMAPADTFWQRMSNGRSVWSNTLNAGTGGSDIDLPCPFRVNGVTYTRLLVGVDGALYLMSPERPEFWWRDVILDPPDLGVTALTGGYVAIAGFCADLHVKARDWGTRVAYGTASLPSGPATVVDFYNLGFESDVASSGYYLFSYQLVLPQNEPNVFYLTYNPMYPAAHFAAQNPTIGVQFPELVPLRAGEDYYNLTWRYTEAFFTAMRRLKFTIGRGTDPASDDTDGDGFKDYEETALFQTDPTVPDDDSDLDGLPDALELRLGTDPDLDDTDHDGVSDLDEFLDGTDPLQPDTDGDGMNDGWERAYDGTEVRRLDPDGVTVNPVPGWTVPFDPGIDNRMDANSHNDPSADPDNDGLSNAEECAMGTNPCHPDTDGDGAGDSAEAAQGSDPNDASDGGVPGSRVPVSFTFGDHSGSHSEKYTLNVMPVSGSGSRPSSFAWLNENYGVCETKTAYLKPGWRYAVRLDHSGTKEGLPTDYDYTLRQTGTLPSNVVITDDQSLFGVDNTSSSFAGAGKVAYLHVLAPPEISAPAVVGVNRDDDDGNGVSDWEDTGLVPGEDDLVEVRVRVAEPSGVLGSVMVTPLVSHGVLWKDRGKAAAVDLMDVIAIPASGTVEKTYYIEGYAASTRYRSDLIEVELQCGSSSMTTSHVFTVVDRVAEPITTALSGGQIANPCCAVAGATVPLKVDVLPRDFPDAEIKWRIVSGGGTFSGGGTGRTVQFAASGGEGALSTVQVDVGDCPGPAPQLSVRMTTPHEVLIFPCAISMEGDEPPITASTLATWLNEVNVIYRQVGLHFSLGAPITNIVNGTWARDGLVDTAAGAQIRNVLSNTGGVEVYFIPGNGGLTEPIGSHTRYGIILKNSANARSLAHEIGHVCGWADIYATDSGGEIPDELYGRVRRDWMPDDWSGGGDVGGFYETDLRQYELISRLLMYGVKSDAKADIPAGSVYGWASDGASGNMNVGRNGMLTYPPYNL